MVEEFSLLKAFLGLLGISTAAAASRTMMSPDKRTIGAFVRGLVLALFAGGVIGALIQDSGFSPGVQGGIVGICAFVADDLLQLTINISTKLRENPSILIDYILRRGGKE
jgi:hypothetical protein